MRLGLLRFRTISQRWFLLLPLVLFGGLVWLFATQLNRGGNPSHIPSPMIGQTVPDFSLPGLKDPSYSPQGFKGFGQEDLQNGLFLVNVWASWCGPCREEHPFLMALSRVEGLTLMGLNYKNRPDDALDFLTKLGNPYDRIGIDPRGQAAIDWGVYGVPESFLIKDGMIIDKHIGPLGQDAASERFLKAIKARLPDSTPSK
jgi:cytochrome c biogenesis protein CcmG/thiol:disulfide interchange protein DsbE